MAKPYMARPYMATAAAAAAAFRCNGDVKLFAGTLPLKNDMLKMQKSYFY